MDGKRAKTILLRLQSGRRVLEAAVEPYDGQVKRAFGAFHGTVIGKAEDGRRGNLKDKADRPQPTGALRRAQSVIKAVFNMHSAVIERGDLDKPGSAQKDGYLVGNEIIPRSQVYPLIIV